MEQEIYSVQEDSNGLLFDTRTSKNLTDPLRIEDFPSSNVYLAKLEPYIYGLTKNIDLNTDLFYNVAKPSVNSGILLDKDGFPLFSLKLLCTYGIGFILSDWLIKDVDGKIKVRFEPNYVYKWYRNDMGGILDLGKMQSSVENNVSITDDEIYSCCKLNIAIPSDDVSYIEPVCADYKSGWTSSVKNETVQIRLFEKGQLFNSAGSLQRATYYNYTVDERLYKEVLYSRLFIGSTLYAFTDDDNPFDSDNWACPSDIDNKLTFITYNINTEKYTTAYNADLMNQCLNTFLRYGINYNRFGCTDVETFMRTYYIGKFNLPKYDLLGIWKELESKELKLYYAGASTGVNIYGPDTDPNTFEDHSFLVEAKYPNGSEIIRKTLFKYVGIICSDVYGNYDAWIRTANSDENLTVIDYSIKSGSSIEEILSNNLSPEKLSKYQTPSEYYANNGGTYVNPDNEDAFNRQSNTVRTWFWLETIKNWCMYTINAGGILYLGAWNGLGGWDPVESLVTLANNSPYWLAYQYNYSKEFFHQGYNFVWTNTDIHSYNNIRYSDGELGRLYYNILLLDKDTLNGQNYNDKFQNTHNSKIYYTAERNIIANVGLGVENRNTEDGKPIKVDDSRASIQIVETQYCPTVVKLSTGSLGILFTMLVESNGIGIDNKSNRSIIDADTANNKCKTIFGSGDTKTIENDWKRLYHNTDLTEENTSKITLDPAEVIYGTPNLVQMTPSKEINTLQLFANRPLPTTDNKPGSDFVDRWK